MLLLQLKYNVHLPIPNG